MEERFKEVYNGLLFEIDQNNEKLEVAMQELKNRTAKATARQIAGGDLDMYYRAVKRFYDRKNALKRELEKIEYIIGL